MRPDTRRSYEERMTDVLRHILGNLDEPLNAVELANRACFSTYHFHRIFRGMVGESVGEFVRRIRLERAAYQLGYGSRVSDVAFEAGFETHESFTRAFRSTFGYTPSDFRTMAHGEYRLPCACGVHFDPTGSAFILRVQSGAIQKMQVDIREKPGFKVVGLRHVGPYYMIGEAFGRLAMWAGQNGIAIGPTVAIYHDNPDITPLAELRSDACLVVPDDFTTDDPTVSVIDIPANRYAVMTYIGPYDGLGNAWNQLCGEWFPSNGKEFGEGPCFELYLSDCSQVPASELVTEIYQPIR